MLMTLPGFEDLVMMVMTPAEMPSLAATILVLMPPVPSDDPALETALELVGLYLFGVQ